MTAVFRIPYVDDSYIRATRHAEFLFQGKGPVRFMDRVMLDNLIRLVVHAATEYRRGAEEIHGFYKALWPEEKQVWPEQSQTWLTSKRLAIRQEQQSSAFTIEMPALDIFLYASSNFETCITSVHRALAFLQRIQDNKDIFLNEKANLPKHLVIYQKSSQKLIKNFRDAIHHNDEHILYGKISAGKCCITSVPLEETNQNGERFGVVERIELGGCSIFFRDLARWITELRACAEALTKAAYDKPLDGVSDQP